MLKEYLRATFCPSSMKITSWEFQKTVAITISNDGTVFVFVSTLHWSLVCTSHVVDNVSYNSGVIGR